MLIYIVIPITIGLASRFTPSNIINNTKKIQFGQILVIGILVFLWGYRDLDIGLDTNSYYYLYEWAKSASLNSLHRYWFEPGYALLTMFSSQVLRLDYHQFLFLVSVFYGCALYAFVRRYSSDYYLSILAFIAFPFMAFYMSGIRNAIMISIMMVSLPLIEQKKVIKIIIYEAIIISGSLLFHKSGLICTLIPLIAHQKENKAIPSVYFIISCLLFVFKSVIYRYIDNNYKDVGEASGIKIGISFIIYLVTIQSSKPTSLGT